MRDESKRLPPEPGHVREKLIYICQEVRAFIEESFRNAPKTSSMPVPAPWKDCTNPMRSFDAAAEEWFERYIQPLFEGNVEALGEENPKLETADYRDFKGTVFLGDMVDGSDLLVAELGNWCSTAVAFSTVRKRILAAVVAHANGRTYYASEDLAKARVSFRYEQPKPPGARVSDLGVDASVKKVASAKFCYYGQKEGHILVPTKLFCDAMPDLGRLYNLGGNPMMAKLTEGRIHAVFDLSGQKAHDVVPGAYIALRAGAVMSTPEGEPIDEQYLYERLLVPKKTIRYVLAASDELRKELCEELCGATMA